MPDISQIFTQLGIQQPMGDPNKGQAQYPNAWSGFAAGMFDAQNQANNLQRGRVEQTRSQLLAMINSIPDNEQNTPLKFKLAADIMQAGDRHWSDKVLAPNKADSLISGMYKIMQDKFPQDQPNTGVATADNGQQVAARPRIAQTDTMQGSGLAGAVAGDPYTGNTLPNVTQAPQPGKLNFANTNAGNWKFFNDVFQDEKTGERYTMGINAKTGISQRFPLGKVKTESEIIAETRAKNYAAVKKSAIDKQFYTRAIANSGMGSEAMFEQLPQHIKEEELAKAAKEVQAELALKTENTKSNIRKNDAIATGTAARIPLIKAQTESLQSRPLEDPNNPTAGDERARKADLELLNKEYVRYKALVADAESKSIKEAKENQARLDEIIRQIKVINAEAKAKPKLRTATKPSAGTAIPKGTPGPIGENNDPVGILGGKKP